MAQQTQLALTIAIITESGTPEAFSFLSASREVSRAEYHLWHGETIHPADQASPWKSQLRSLLNHRNGGPPHGPWLCGQDACQRCMCWTAVASHLRSIFLSCSPDLLIRPSL